MYQMKKETKAQVLKTITTQLKVKHGARLYADSVIEEVCLNANSYSLTSYEIHSGETKSGNPFVIEFDSDDFVYVPTRKEVYQNWEKETTTFSYDTADGTVSVIFSSDGECELVGLNDTVTAVIEAIKADARTWLNE